MPNSNQYQSDYVAGGFHLTGPRVFGLLLLFFGAVGGVNAIMVHYALSTMRGEVNKHPYEAGLAYNKELDAAQAQDALKWKVDVSAKRAGDGLVNLDVTAHDAADKPILALSLKATFEAPADMNRDLNAILSEDRPGHYHASLKAPAGGWTLSLEADRDGKRLFLSNNRIMLE